MAAMLPRFQLLNQMHQSAYKDKFLPNFSSIGEWKKMPIAEMLRTILV